MKDGERYDRRVGDQWDTRFFSDRRKQLQIGDFQLRVRDHFQKEGTGIAVDVGTYFVRVCQVTEAGFHTESGQCVLQQRKRIPEQVRRRNDICIGTSDRHQRIADSGHSRVQGGNAHGSGNGAYTIFKILYGRIRDP